MSALSPSWLPVFLAVAEHGSFNRAAEVLLLSQPAVSQKIRHLEARLGVGLFERTPTGVHLTEAGKVLHRYAHAMQWLVLAAEGHLAVPDVSAKAVRGDLRLGGTPSLAGECLPRWLQAFNQVYPHVLLHLQTATTPHLVQRIAHHALHLAIIEGELPDETEVAYAVLRELNFRLVTPDRPPWNQVQRLPLKAVHDAPFVARPLGAQTRRWMERVFARHHVHPRIVAELDNPETIKQAVAHDLGVTLLPACFLQDATEIHLHVVTITDVPLRRYLKAIWAKDVPLYPLALAFLETLSGEFSQLEEVIQRVRHPDWNMLYTLLGRARRADAASTTP